MASPLIRRIASMFPERDRQARVAGRRQYLERAAPSAVAPVRVAANCCGGRRNGAFFVHLPVGDSKGVACSRSNSSAKRMDDGLPRFRLFRAFSRMATPRQRREPTSLLCATSRVRASRRMRRASAGATAFGRRWRDRRSGEIAWYAPMQASATTLDAFAAGEPDVFADGVASLAATGPLEAHHLVRVLPPAAPRPPSRRR